MMAHYRCKHCGSLDFEEVELVEGYVKEGDYIRLRTFECVYDANTERWTATCKAMVGLRAEAASPVEAAANLRAQAEDPQKRQSAREAWLRSMGVEMCPPEEE